MARLLLILLLLPLFTFGQNLTSTESSGNSNIYNDAIQRYIGYNTKGVKPLYDTLFIQKDIILSDSIMSFKHRSYKVLLELDDIKRKLEIETSFILHRVHPLQVNKGKFVVGIVPFVVKKEGNEITYSNTGGYSAEYTYDSMKKRFKFVRHSFRGY